VAQDIMPDLQAQLPMLFLTDISKLILVELLNIFIPGQYCQQPKKYMEKQITGRGEKYPAYFPF